jgi:hypothetical protein
MKRFVCLKAIIASVLMLVSENVLAYDFKIGNLYYK